KGSIKLHEFPLELPLFLNTLKDEFERQASKKGIHFDVTALNTLPEFILADEARLTQILSILLENAIKFTDKDGGVVLAVSSSMNMDRSLLTFSVIDSGAGIPLEQQDNIFKLFTQADGSATRSFGGTGIGLALATRLAETMGGRIEVKSIVGTGSNFQFSAPFSVPENIPVKANRA
ncbi:MAG: hybrid sensor histidine kinase/response regulator, partial [Candidatus Dadabacteria bacterium]